MLKRLIWHPVPVPLPQNCYYFKRIRFSYECLCPVNSYFIPDPCANTRCEYASKCRVSGDRSVSCVCPSCPTPSEDDVVCGDDGVSYADICAMKASSCRDKKKIKVAYIGQCGKSYMIGRNYEIVCCNFNYHFAGIAKLMSKTSTTSVNTKITITNVEDLYKLGIISIFS